LKQIEITLLANTEELTNKQIELEQKLHEECETHSKDKSESDEKITTLTQQLDTIQEEAIVNVQIAEKKSARLVKELQDQLAKSRSSFEKLQKELHAKSIPPLQKASSLVRTNSNASLIVDNITNRLTLSQSGDLGTEKSPSKPVPTNREVSLDALQKESNVLAVRVGELQTEKWELQEKNEIFRRKC